MQHQLCMNPRAQLLQACACHALRAMHKALYKLDYGK